jgi:hypothetical protein
MKSIPCNGEILAGPGLCFPIRLDKKELDIERTNSEYDWSWQSPSNREQVTRPGGSWHTNAFRKVAPGGLRFELVHPGCTNIRMPLGSGCGLSDSEDRRHFDCATWLHKACQMPKDAHLLKLCYNYAEIVLQRNAPVFREGKS